MCVHVEVRLSGRPMTAAVDREWQAAYSERPKRNDMATILDEILGFKRQEVERQKGEVPLGVLERQLATSLPVRSLTRALSTPGGVGSRIIAEIKRRSPVKGELKGEVDPLAIARMYEANGAAAISLITDYRFFAGRREDLPLLRREVSIPIFRKDFIIDEYQLVESRVLGADAVLLIVAGLPPERLEALHRFALFLEMEVLVEVHTREEMEKALDLGARVLGINNRNLHTFVTDLQVTLDLVTMVPPGRVVVSESGIRNRNEIEQLERAGVHAFLVGESLMRSEDAAGKLRELVGG